MFLSRLHTVDVPPNLWRLEQPLLWEDSGEFGRMEFPAGMVTDLASTPQAMRNLSMFDPCGPSRLAAVGHDYLYAHGRTPAGVAISRARADRFLYVALLAEGVSTAVAWSYWAGVRMGGWVPWNAYRRGDAKDGPLPGPRSGF